MNQNELFDGRKNIFLDFMGPDMWKTFPTFSGKYLNKRKILSQSLNIAVLLTNEYCILPPAFIAQSKIVRDVMKEKSSFLRNKLILFPLRESSLEYYFAKKQREYNYVKDSHQEFYKEAGQIFIKKHNNAVIHRKATMGATIAEHWRNLSDDSELWQPVVMSVPHKADQLREIPSLLQSQGVSITLEAIKKVARIEGNNLDFALNQAIQHEYLITYLQEYDSVILKNIPPKPVLFNFLITTEFIYYDYIVFEDVLRVFELDFLKNVSAEIIIQLRDSMEWMGFMNLFWNVCGYFKNRSIIKNYYLEIKKRLFFYKKNNKSLHLLGKIHSINTLCNEILEKSDLINVEETKLKNEAIVKTFRKEIGMKDKVFLVHGHDENLRKDTELFCRRIGLEPVILAENASCGMTIIEKIEQYSDVEFAIVLYSACDEGRTKGETEFKFRARQNVVFEHGYMVAKLGRNKVVSLVSSDVETPGDLDGVVYISLQDSAWKNRIKKELHAAGLNIDWSKD